MDLAFVLGEEVVAVASTAAVLERMASSILGMEEPSVDEVLARTGLLKRRFFF